MKLSDAIQRSSTFLVLIFHLTAARSAYKEAKFVAARGQLSCNGKPARNAKASIVAHTPENVYVLNDGPTDSLGGYSLEAAFLPTGVPLHEFKLRIQHECFDNVRSAEENRTRNGLRPRKRLMNATKKTGTTHVFRELSVPIEYVYDWTLPPKVYDFSIDLAH
ncbi:hypothetical protein AAVH_24992 [Aphelenchoides avenae]|nr:hypothetical protein AAVH_24992 [Aphelenchus avenae]